MAKKYYQVEIPEGNDVTPFIFPVDGEDQGLIWREAKKVLRKWYLDQASALRNYSEADFQKEMDNLEEGANKVESSEPVPSAG